MDTLILHDGSVPLRELTAAAEAAAQDGSVLVATSMPKGRSWKKLVRMEGGEAR